MPKSSRAIKRDAIGQFVTPQNTETIPIGAPKDEDKPKTGAITQPNVAPTKNEGIISPPLYPQASVIAVKSIFQKKSVLRAVPPIADTMTSIPVPL